MQFLGARAASCLCQKLSPLLLTHTTAFKFTSRKNCNLSLKRVQAWEFESLEIFETYIRSPDGQNQISNILESDDVPQILKDKIAPALIPELFLSDFSDVPVHLQGKDRNTFATKAIDRSLLLNCNTETEIEGMLKGHLNIAQDSAVEVRWTYGSESTKADDFFFNWDLSTGLRTNIEAAGCIVVVFLTCHGNG